jgi:hypothetical protein
MIASIHPPADAEYDEVNFARWVKDKVLTKCLQNGILNVMFTPTVQADGKLYLTVETDVPTASRIKAALYN